MRARTTAEAGRAQSQRFYRGGYDHEALGLWRGAGAMMEGAVLYVLGAVVAVCVLLRIYGGWQAKRDWKKLEAARDEYLEIEKTFGYVKAREHCPHKVVEFGQTGVSGVVTVTTKWCKVCKKNLGPAHLKRTLFGKRWE